MTTAAAPTPVASRGSLCPPRATPGHLRTISRMSMLQLAPTTAPSLLDRMEATHGSNEAPGFGYWVSSQVCTL